MSEEREELIAPSLRGLAWELVRAERLPLSTKDDERERLIRKYAKDIAVVLAHQEMSGWREPEGWKLVPVEPDRAMWAAMGNALVGYKQRHHDKVAEDVWTGAIAVAPSPPTRQEMIHAAV